MDDRLKSLMDKGYEKEDAEELLELAMKLSKEKKNDGDEKTSLDEKKIERIVEAQINKVTEQLEKPDDSKKTGYENINTEDDLFKSVKSDVWLLGHVLQRHPKNMDAEKIASGYKNENKPEKANVKMIQKALDTSDHSALVPTEMREEMLTYIEKKSVILDNLRVVPMPSNPWTAPYQSGSITAYGIDEATDDSASSTKASDTAVSEITFNAKKIGGRALWSRELDEDSAIAILPMLREDFQRATRDSWERTTIFGDESTSSNINTHNDDSNVNTTAGQKSYWLQADGLVHHCIVTNTGQAKDLDGTDSGDSLSTIGGGTAFLGVRNLLDKYGDNPEDVIYICNRQTIYDAMQLDDFQTMDKFGPQATVLTGQLGMVYGSPVMVSAGLPATDDNGKISGTAANNDQGSILAVNRRVGAIVGRRGELRIAVDENISTDQYEGVVYSRYDIQMPRTEAVAYGYDIDQS